MLTATPAFISTVRRQMSAHVLVEPTQALCRRRRWVKEDLSLLVVLCCDSGNRIVGAYLDLCSSMWKSLTGPRLLWLLWKDPEPSRGESWLERPLPSPPLLLFSWPHAAARDAAQLPRSSSHFARSIEWKVVEKTAAVSWSFSGRSQLVKDGFCEGFWFEFSQKTDCF